MWHTQGSTYNYCNLLVDFNILRSKKKEFFVFLDFPTGY